MQRIYQILAGYFNDNDADELITDPVFCTVLGKDALTSQPTMSRFFNRLDEGSLLQFEKIFHILRHRIYGIRPPENILLDLDSTLLQTYAIRKVKASTIIIKATDSIHCCALTV